MCWLLSICFCRWTGTRPWPTLGWPSVVLRRQDGPGGWNHQKWWLLTHQSNLWKLDEIGYIAVKNNLQRVISPSNILIQPWQNHWFIGGDAEHPAKQSLVWGEKQNDTWLCLFLEFPLHISLRPRSVSAPGVCLSVCLEALALSRISLQKSYREAVRLEKVQVWHHHNF